MIIIFEINKRLRDLREELSLTRQAFGLPLGVSDSVIKNIEYNVTEPKPLLLDMICKTYNVNEEWLKEGTGEMFRQPSTEDVIIEAFAKLAMSDGNNFKKQFIAALAALDDEAWDALEAFARKIVTKTDEDDKKGED